MNADELAPAWYILRSDRLLAKAVNLSHWPYTALHLSFVLIGAAAAPELSWKITGLMLLAFFLGMGIASHALDLLAGDPLRLKISRRLLGNLAFASLSGAAAIGAYYVWSERAWWFLPFIASGVFVAVAYNLELFAGKFHSDFWFAFSWAAFPCLAGYSVNAGTWVPSPAVAGMAMVCYALARVQRALSIRARYVRRSVGYATGDLWAVEAGLAWLCLAGPALALALILWRS